MKHYRIPAVFAVLAASAAVAWGATNFVQKADGSMCFRINSAFIETDSWCWSNAGDLTIDDGVTDSPSITMTDATDQTVAVKKVDAGALTITSSASGSNDGLNVLTGNVLVGNGTPGETINGEDLYVEGISEFDGQANFDGAADFDSTVDFSGAISGNADISILTPGDLIVGNGTPSVTQNGEDAYIEGTFEVDGASEFDGAVDFDSTITVGTTAINVATLTAMARTEIMICGDATTVNNNTVYYGPSEVVVSSATVGQLTCDTTAVGNTTEATADAPALSATAFYPLGMVCYNPDNASGITYTLRSAEAAITPAIAVTLADNVLSNAVSVTATTAVASGATLAVAVSSSGDIGTIPFICKIQVAF